MTGYKGRILFFKYLASAKEFIPALSFMPKIHEGKDLLS
jgi:hypothetical protein